MNSPVSSKPPSPASSQEITPASQPSASGALAGRRVTQAASTRAMLTASPDSSSTSLTQRTVSTVDGIIASRDNRSNCRSRYENDSQQSIDGRSQILNQATPRRESFADRAGILSPPDTLMTTSLRYSLYGDKAFNNDRFLIEQANEKKFNVVVNTCIQDAASWNHLMSILSNNNFYHETSDRHTSVYGQGTSNAKVTVNYTRTRPPIWNEDTIFMGAKSAHMRTATFCQPIDTYSRALIDYYRNFDNQAAGVRDPKGLKLITSHGGVTSELYNSVFKRSVFSHSIDPPRLRDIPIEFSIDVFIEGGNMLSNGSKFPGNRVFLIGVDSIALTSRHAQNPNYPNIVPETIKHMSGQLGLEEGDKLIVVPQRTFHLDMSMTFTGEKEVVLADSLKSHNIQFPNKAPDKLTIDQFQIENLIEDRLRTEGLSVIRKPWSGSKNTDFCLFNGEFVKSNDTGKVYFLTNGIFNVPEFARREIESDLEAFYQERDIEAVLTPSTDSSAYLSMDGGLGCLTNSLHS